MSEKKNKKKRRGAWRSIRKWIRRLIILIILIAAALFGTKYYIQSQAKNGEERENYSRVQAVRGAMSDTVYGTGTTSARNQPNILAEADGTLTQLRVSVGDEVRKGDILGVMTNDEIDDTITDLEFKLWDLDETITGTRSGNKSKVIEAPVAGRVMQVFAKADDDALAVFRREGALAIISTDERMKVDLVGETGALGLALDEKVMVIGDNIYAEGTVVDLTRQGTCASITIHEDLLPVDDDFDGDGRADMIVGKPVRVENLAGEAIGEGTLQVNKPMGVSSFGGTITYVDVQVGDEVARAERLFRLEDTPITLTIEELRLQRETSAKELEEAKELRENLVIIAPCDGTIASVEVEEGDEITSGTLFGSILHGEDMNLTIAVDELDVVDVKIGQPVSITIDALSNLKLKGEVYKIAPVGTSSGGVTTYDVELTFDAAGTGVRSGMNATGEVEIASSEDALYVPVEALMTMNNQTYVMVADGGSTTLAEASASAQSGRNGQRGQRGGAPQMGNMPQMGNIPQMGNMPQSGAMPQGMPERGAGDAAAQTEAAEATGVQVVIAKAKALGMKAYDRLMAWLYEGVETDSAQQATGSLVRVEVGMQNDDYAEIVSGLSEGDTVLYAEEQKTTSMFGAMMNMGGMRF